jgi:hypothetical protein
LDHIVGTDLPRLRVSEVAREWRQRVLRGGSSSMRRLARTAGIEGLRRMYAQSLAITLEVVAHLAQELLRKRFKHVALTADHGELLGEGGRFSHRCFDAHPILREVPWLRLQGINIAGLRAPSAGPARDRAADVVRRLRAAGLV